jgi:hypothetical protein
MPNHYGGDLLPTMAISGLARVSGRREWLDSTCCENSFSAPVSDGAPQSERARSQGQELHFRGNAKEFCAAPQAGGGVGTVWATQSKQKDAASGGLGQDGLAVKRKRCPVEAGLE